MHTWIRFVWTPSVPAAIWHAMAELHNSKFMLLGITQWLTLFSRKYGSFFPSGFQFFWKFFLHSSQDFYKCKNKPWKRRNFQSVPSAFLVTLGSSCLRSPCYLFFIPLWFTCLGLFIQAVAVRKPWLGSVLCCPQCLSTLPGYPSCLVILCTRNSTPFFLPLSGKCFLNKLSDTIGLQIFLCSPGLGEWIRWIS